MKAFIAIASSALLLLMAALQYNDADGISWMIMYTSAALVPLYQVFLSPKRAGLQTAVFTFALVLAIVALLSALPQANISEQAVRQSVQSPMAAATPYIEGNRELLGSLISIAIILGFRYRCPARQPS